ncbi:MAG: hypothetical protein JNK29_00520, partial [Anaerolineales bacterium]|nr:hypothetical protein [Anaerolineales bacterium]
ALAGAGLAAAWQSARRRGLWPALLAGSGLVTVAIVLLTNTTGWAAWLIPLSVSLAAAGAVGVWRLDGGWQRGAALLGLAGLILAPGAYALTPVLSPGDVALPYAGPELLQRAGRPGGAPGTADSGRLAAYLLRQRAAETFLAAALNANTAAPLILATGEPVMALGGFSGRDPILTEAELAERVRAGQVRFFLLPAGGRAQGVGAGPAPQNQGALLQWVAARCTPVPPAEWGGANAGPAGGQLALFDCARAR